VKRVVLILLLLAVAVALAPGRATAAIPCRDQIFDDWYHDGHIASTYPIACYRDALKHIPPDARIYSSLETDIKSAMQAALQRLRGQERVPAQVGRGLPSQPAGGVEAASVSLHGLKTPRGKGSREALTERNAHPHKALGPVAEAAANAPLPILVLGGIALALVATGAAGLGFRRYQRDR
jgi:hypothetical protein